MSFICAECNRALKNGIKPEIIIVETRKGVYPKRYKKDTEGEYIKDSSGKLIVIDNGGSGFETVREVTMCKACAKAHKENLRRSRLRLIQLQQ